MANEIVIGVYEEEEDIDQRIFALVHHLARALNMSVSSIKGYFERDKGQVIIKDLPTLKQLRSLGAIGLTATSTAIFPLDRLVHSLASAKGPNKDLVKRISTLKLEANSDSESLSLGEDVEKDGRHSDEDDVRDLGDKLDEEENEVEVEVDAQGASIPKVLTLKEVSLLPPDYLT